ncbi:RNA polymerase sigma-70 factor (ECF subfamily) [Chitinophaga skermanii]|uniref:RNA polymerase sigma-70 factor (ECF subfamily) n=1 Tax=Chitinophaga skermanii TaxID=331697 RepID=A0A327QXH4_9BACT|nr:RNA polymerase sigma-70 factor [Chitinophaga skermanii]RAJ08498.1 RNA polymerase sigma-70 factor (ECF subfamily) [Chitinophaga skermanii]
MGEQCLLDSFEQQFRAHYKKLRIIAIGIIGDDEVAKDLVQDFYAKCWQKRHELTFNVSFEAYASKAIRNACLNYLANQKREEERKASLPNVPDGLDEVALREKFYTVLYNALQEMPPQRRKILLLSVKEGMSYQQIAEHTGISINTVKFHMQAAYQYLREQGKDISLLTIVAFIGALPRF